MLRERRARAVLMTAVSAFALVLAAPTGTATAATAGVVDLKWFPLQPGTQFVYDGTVVDEDGAHHHRVVFTVSDLVKRVDGVLTTVAWDRDFQDGALTEAELALFAENAHGDVRTLGEYPEEYEDGGFAGAPSTWVSGRSGAKGGVLVPNHPRVGTPAFVQGKALGIDFFDVGQVVHRGAYVCVPAGCFDHVLVVEEWSPLAPEDGKQLKYYAPGVGLVKIAALGGDSQETLSLTRIVRLGPVALAAARAETLRLDRRGHRFSDVWAKTPDARRR